MNLSDKDRKILWGKSGNRCAICKMELIRPNEDGTDYNIGQECHIISKTPNGPRHDPNYKNYDSYENLILLCSVHHKEIDDKNNISKFSPQQLRKIKAEHEKWVDDTLSKKPHKEKDWNTIFRALDLT